MLILLTAPLGQPQARPRLANKLTARRRSARSRSCKVRHYASGIPGGQRSTHRASLTRARHPDGPSLRVSVEGGPSF